MAFQLALHRICALTILLSTACAFAQVTPEEEASVRQAYAKVSFAIDMGSLLLNTVPSSSAVDQKSSLAKGSVTYKIGSLQGGPFSDISRQAFRDVVTVPADEILTIHPTSVTYTEQSLVPPDVRSQNVASATWSKAEMERPLDAFNMSLSEFASRAKLGNPSRYAIADVTASFQGIAKSYKALFLFRSKGDFESFDLVTNGVGLFKTVSVYPHVVLETRRRFEPAIQTWISSHQVGSCTPGTNSVCCDEKTMLCGVSAEDVATSLAAMPDSVKSSSVALSKPETPTAAVLQAASHNYGDLCSDFNSSNQSSPAINTASDRTQHVTGNHSFTTVSYGTCTYFNSVTYINTHQCGSTATAYVNGGVSDNGVTSIPLFYHVKGEADGYGTATSFNGPGGATATATGAAAIRDCLAGSCSVSISVNVPGAGSVSFPADAIWTQTVQNPISCGVPITNFLQPTYPDPGNPTPSQCALYPTLPQCLNPR